MRGSRMKDLCISFKAFLLALWSFDECFNNVVLTLLPSYHTVIPYCHTTTVISYCHIIQRLLSWKGTLKTDLVLDKF